jgi:hypothetical protein
MKRAMVVGLFWLAWSALVGCSDATLTGPADKLLLERDATAVDGAQRRDAGVPAFDAGRRDSSGDHSTVPFDGGKPPADSGKPPDGGCVAATAPDPGTGPFVSAACGAWSHGAMVTLQGARFGTKPSPPPTVWDDASGSDPAQKWDFVYPYTNDPAFRLTYRTPAQVTKANGVMGGVALPHGHIQRYLAGAHYNSAPPDAHSGYDVCAGKNGQQGKVATYISYYRRIDPDWHINTGCSTPSDCDHNFKEYDYAAGDGYVGDGPNLYFGLGAGENPLGASIVWGANYGGGMNVAIHAVNTAFMNWYPQTGGVFSGAGAPGPGTGWAKVELILKHHSADGFHRIYQDNTLVWDVSLEDDGLAAGPRAETVLGGYAREYGSSEAYKNNWRYYADVYYDHSFARVMLANAPNYASATVVEPQPLTLWSAGAIQLKVNLGKLSGGTAYVFVVDGTNQRADAGLPVAVGP